MNEDQAIDQASQVGESCSWYDVPCHLSSFADWLLGVILWVPQKAWQLILDGLAAVINAIPVPGFFADASGLFAAIPSGVWYFAGPMHIGSGITIVLAAYALRFTIRRIPLIG